MIRFAALIVSGLFVMASALPVHAQTDRVPGPSQPPSADGQFLRLTPEKLDAFVAVAVRIGRMKRIWQPRIRGARTRDEAVKYQDAAIKQMLAIIEGAPGITVGEYMGIAQAAQTDKDLARTIADMIAAASP